MQITTNPLFAEMQAIKGEIAPAAPISPESIRQVNNTQGAEFSELLGQAIGTVNQLQSNSSSLATRLEMGDTRVTLSDTVVAREKASVAFEATMQVRNKFVEAYKQIMSMTV
ncbi:flagellar hook-basal body complex protein FliE [Shewanella sp. NIFS-20-20]|uniref:flagellar hook-basal body complex protein FliE n=1 Tax=Shewanella sp. NIFS-20-20 TaxID=2853806 RepID=UPI001C466921|nr:flagellar hook-basal body complex protein FliE [Shewanella sp. NIFS-20-20]MBV7314791.1 flagellar hook-basal body complex protein FliE [Shewanella sp. NIFS-20-20]